MGLKTQEKNGLLLMPTAKVTKNVSVAIGGGNVLCSTLISIKTKAWLYSFRKYSLSSRILRICSAPELLMRKASATIIGKLNTSAW